MENSISRGVDGIVIAPNSSSALNSVIDRARQAGVKVITVDTRVTTASEGFIGTDNKRRAAGRPAHVRAAQGAARPPARCSSSRPWPESSPFDRDAGFRQGLAEKCPKVDASLQRYNNNDINTAASQVNDALTANPNLLGVFADNNTSGIGAARAIQDNNAADKVPVVAFDSDPRRTRRSPPARSTLSWCRTRTSSATRESSPRAWPP